MDPALAAPRRVGAAVSLPILTVAAREPLAAWTVK